MSKTVKPASEGAGRRPRRWWVNVLFVALILLAALGLYLVRSHKPGLYAHVDFGMGVTEDILLSKDGDYLYEVGAYVVHLQVKDGAIAFMDSQCPDGVCEDFGWLNEEGQWACCMPAGVFITIETESA